MDNKNKVIMKLFKAYLLDELDNNENKIDKTSDIFDKEALKKRSPYKKELSKESY